MTQKRRPERLKPSLKLLTPDEKKVMDKTMAEIREMWKSLYAKNKWKPQDPLKKVQK
jgi:hypothetical protein